MEFLTNYLKEGLCLPSGSNLTDIELDRVVSAINTYFASC